MQNSKRPRVGGVVIPMEQRRLPEHLANLEAEAAVLGAVIRDPKVYAGVSEVLQSADFFMLWHGWVWYAFDQITARSQHIDLISVADELQALKQLGSDGEHRLAMLAANTPSAYSVDTYAQIVRDCATRLRVVKAADQMVQAAFDRQTFREAEAFVDECNRLLFEATDQVIHRADTNLTAVLDKFVAQAEDAFTNGERRGLKSGYSNLDDLLRGAVPGELTVIAGAEGMGKTTFVLGLARNLAKVDRHVAIFTLEMSQEEIIRSFVSMESGLPKRALKALDFSGDQWAKFTQGVGAFNSWHVHVIDEFSSLSPIQLRRRLRTLVSAQHEQIDAVVIDGLWLMEANRPTDKRNEDVRNITRDLIVIARDFGVPIYLTHQYNGDANARKDKRPVLHDLAESAGVRRNAQVILGLYRNSYYGVPHNGQDVSEVHVLKDRNGSGAQGNHADFYFDVTHNLFLPKVGYMTS